MTKQEKLTLLQNTIDDDYFVYALEDILDNAMEEAMDNGTLEGGYYKETYDSPAESPCFVVDYDYYIDEATKVLMECTGISEKDIKELFKELTGLVDEETFCAQAEEKYWDKQKENKDDIW